MRRMIKRARLSNRGFSDGKSPLDDLPVEIFCLLATFVGFLDLCALESISRSIYNSVRLSGTWRTLAEKDLGIFESRNHPICCEKRLYFQKLASVKAFRKPFNDRRVNLVPLSDDVAYCNAIVSLYRLKALPPGQGFYIEFAVKDISDNLSVSLVDFDGNGNSSLTFSPDTGAVICETKAPGEPLSGNYACVLPGAPHFGKKNEGLLAIFISNTGEIMFLRNSDDAWASTGYVCGTDWVQGGLATPCIAFRRPGKYDVKINCALTTPKPPHVEKSVSQSSEIIWKPLRWILRDGETDNEESSSDEDN